MATTNERRSAGGKVRLAPMTGRAAGERACWQRWLTSRTVTIYVTVAGLPHRFAELRATSTSVSAAGAPTIDQQLHPVEAEKCWPPSG